jgi:ABC-type branched-subunit amino acid transport system ATPase component
VPEGRQVFKPLSVEDNLELGAYLHYRPCFPFCGNVANSWPEHYRAESSRCCLSAGH